MDGRETVRVGRLTAEQERWTGEVMDLLGLGRAAETDAPSAARAEEARRDIPLDTVAIARARIGWIATRRALVSELERLKGAILACAADDAEADAVAAHVDDIFAPLDALDAGLEEALEALVDVADGPERARIGGRARAIAEDLRAALDTPFFAEIDDNPFAPVAVRARAQASLAEIARALAH